MSGAIPGPRRVVSLLASGTELVCALGLGDRLVGRSHECDYPAWVSRLPVLSRPTFEVSGTSGQIDARVRERLRAGAPLYEVDEALLARLAPDIVITQSHCEVCAVSPGDLAHGVEPRLERRQVVALQSGTVEGVLAGFTAVAEVLGAAESGRRLVDGIRARLDALAARTQGLPRPSVLCLEWLEPPFAIGNWGPELIALAGGVCAIGSAGTHSTAITWPSARAADADVLVIAPCGFPVDRTLAELGSPDCPREWADLRAVRSGRACIADGNLYFNRSGPLLFETPEILGEILHPDVFPRRHGPEVWRPIR